MKNLISHLFSVLTQYQKSKFEFRKEYLMLQHQIEIEKIQLYNGSVKHISKDMFEYFLVNSGGALTQKIITDTFLGIQYGFPFKTHEENLTKGCCFSMCMPSESDFDAMLELLLTHGISLIKKENIKSN